VEIGLGSRQSIAGTMVMFDMYLAACGLVKVDDLRGPKPCADCICIEEGFDEKALRETSRLLGNS
jgi:hypothetical protein